MKAIPETCCVH